MVCLGNICRSPLADGLLRRKTQEKSLPIIVDSAGTSGHHAGESPDNRMQETAASFGTPINDLRSRQFRVSDFEEFDTIFVMDQSNYTNVLKLARTQKDKNKIHLLLEYTKNNTITEVPDPYFGGKQGFIDVYKLLDEATDKLIEQLIHKI